MNDLDLTKQDEKIDALARAIFLQTEAVKRQTQIELQRIDEEKRRVEALERIDRKLDLYNKRSETIVRLLDTVYRMLLSIGGTGTKLDAIIAFLSVVTSDLGQGRDVDRLRNLLEVAMQDAGNTSVNLNIHGGVTGQVAGSVTGDQVYHSNVAEQMVLDEVRELLQCGIHQNNYADAEEHINNLAEDTLNLVLEALTGGRLKTLADGAGIVLKLVKGKYRFMRKEE